MAHARMKPLRIVIFQEDERLCAQYVDYDLSAQARTLPELYKALHRLIVSHVAVRRRHGQEPFQGLPPAPTKYREMFERSRIPLPPQLVREVVKGGRARSAQDIEVPVPEVRLVATAS